VERNKTLEHIANGIQAASKIQKVYKSAFRSASGTPVIAAGRPMLAEIIKIIAEHSPDTHRKILGETLNKSYQYSEAYKNIKQHLRATRNQAIDKEALVKTLNAMRPLLSNRRKAMVDKLLKIYQMLKS